MIIQTMNFIDVGIVLIEKHHLLIVQLILIMMVILILTGVLEKNV